MDRIRRVALVAAFALLLSGLAMAPGLAAPEKMFSIQAPASISASAGSISITIKNETPNGNSNIKSFTLSGSGAGFAFTGVVSPGTGTLSNSNQTIAVSSISPIKPSKSTTFTFGITHTAGACGAGSISWTGRAFTGDSLSGDEFRLVGSSSQLTTNVGVACNATISVSKYEDTNVNGAQDEGEVAPSVEFTFDLKSGATVIQTETTVGGALTFDPVAAGEYSVCEQAVAGWVTTDPSGGSGCKTVNAAADATTDVSFGNALGTLGCTTEDNTISVTGDDDASVAISGIRLENSDGSDCLKIPYRFEENPEGGFFFTKDLAFQPNAQFLLTQTVVRDTTTAITTQPFAPNTVNGYTTEITYDPDGVEGYHAIPPCAGVTRDGDGAITGATLPTGDANPDDDTWCVAGQEVLYGYDGVADADEAGTVTIVTKLYGRDDPVTRTKPS